MRLLTLSVAAAATAALPVVAQEMTMDYDDLIRTRDLTGENVYTTNEAWDEGEWADATWDEVDAGWNNIGEIEDVILNADGEMVGIVAEVGGFLDIADKHVMLSADDFRIVPMGDDDYAAVTRWSEEQLEELEDVDQGWWQ